MHFEVRTPQVVFTAPADENECNAPVTVKPGWHGITIEIEGYRHYGESAVLIDMFPEHPEVVIYADPDSDEPTHRISLEALKESA